MDASQTIPQYFLQTVQKYGQKKVALRQKEFGIWREFNWQESYQQVQQFSLGLLALGLKRGDHVSTVGDNDRQYFWGYLGILALGGVQVGLFTDAIASEMAYIIDHSDSKFVLAKDQEQCDKMLEIRSQIPKVKNVIYWDEHGLSNYNDPWLISYEEVQAKGRTWQEQNQFEQEIAKGKSEDLCILCYTSGTTGLPKGAMLSHSNLIKVTGSFYQVDARYDTDNHISLLPLGWIAEHALGVAPHVMYGLMVNFPEEPETVQANVREIAPEGILYNSRLWDNLVGMVQVRINQSSYLNRKLYEWFLPTGYKVADAQFKKESINFLTHLQYRLGNLLVFAPIRNQLGLSKIRYAYTAGAALSPDAMRFFHALGINLKQIYGSTEVTGGVTVHRDGDVRFDTVGQPMPEVTIRIADDGEIQIGGPTVFVGYYKNPEKTSEALAIDPDGKRWFRTGDAGYLDKDGHVVYQDRVKEMITLSNGERFSPQFIEGRLKFSPYIKDVMAVGGKNQQFVTALIVIDFANMGNWAERRGIGYTTFTDLAQKPEVYQLVLGVVQKANENLPINGRVKRFVLMHKEFDADESEMTRSRKLKRNVLYDRYQEIIEGMYAGKSTIRIRSIIKYQDGSEGIVETSLTIASA